MLTRFRIDELFAKDTCFCKFKFRSAKNKRKKSIKIAFASWHVWLESRDSDFWRVRLFFCDNWVDEVSDNKSLELPVEKMLLLKNEKKKSKFAQLFLE